MPVHTYTYIFKIKYLKYIINIEKIIFLTYICKGGTPDIGVSFHIILILLMLLFSEYPV